ncbi:Ribonuclease H-like domain containing protein [Parasponia andersonii]|uniref:Ribonuclease H-like domain containing protein n=1 Tax=Parasponia andersonii TaxID=3476 RepID=A0A2P5CYX0_PARAD|nr:Ribonuclease H-like domain containing protein [Parasponia andersonii]
MLYDSNFLGNLLTLQDAYGIEAIELFAWHAWILWFYKNAWVHNKREIPVHVIAFQAQAKWNDFRLPNLPPTPIQAAQPQSWSCPHFQFFKLNTDASLMVIGNKMGLGGVVRDYRGKVMVAFSYSHHLNYSAEVTEVMVVHKGIQIARDNGLHPLIVESDASNVVSLIDNRSYSMADIGIITHEIQNMLSSMLGSATSYSPTSCNKVAHVLAKWVVSNTGDFVLFEDFPRWLLCHCEEDLTCCAF